MIKIFRWKLYLAVVAIIIVLLFDKLIMPLYTRHGQEIEVPDLTSMFFEDARELLKQMDLKIVEEEKKFDSSNKFPIGYIMAQNPPPASKVKTGRRIYVITSKGEPVIEMPQLVRRSERNAVFELQKLGLILGEVNYEHSEFFHEGVISEQSIPPDTELKPGTVVDITVSLGQFPDKFIVPDVVGRSLRDARRIIFQSGLTLGEVSFQTEDDLLPETVIHQFPEANLEVTQGDTVKLLVSRFGDKAKDLIE
ncbi:MAG: PASTA domain-containing protein [bacterium]|nr:PASTA domain-containing protein [bacterium]